MKNLKEIADVYLEARKEKLTESKAFLKVVKLLEDIYQREGLSILSKSILEITNICCVKAKDAEVFGKGYFGIIAGGGDSFGDEEAILFEKLVDKFPNSVKLAEMLADIYGAIVNETGDKTYTEKLDNLSKNNPALENAALQRLYSLVDSHSDKNITLDEYTKNIGKAKDIYMQYQKTDFAKTYANGLKYLVYEQEEEDALKTIALLEELLKIWNDDIVSNYLDALSKLTWKQDEKGCLETVEKMENYCKHSSYKEKILAMNLAYTLANYFHCVEGIEKDKVIDKIDKLSVHWAPAKKMAYELSIGIGDWGTKPVKAK